MATYSVDGVPLDDPYGRWSLLLGTRRRPFPAVHAANVQVTGRDGDLPITGEDREATVVGLSLLVKAITPNGEIGTEDDLENNLEALTALLGVNHRTVVLRYSTDTLVRVADARFIAGAEPQVIPGANAYTLDVVARIPGVYWRDESETTWTGLLPGATQGVTTMSGATAPIGDAVIRFTGPANNPSMTDLATGVTVSYGGFIASGNRLIVDCGQMRASLVDTNTWDLDAGDDVTGDVESTGPRSSSRWLRLTPVMAGTDPLNRWVTVTTAASSTSGSSKAEIRARRAFL